MKHSVCEGRGMGVMRRLRNKTEVRKMVSSNSTGGHYAVWKQRFRLKERMQGDNMYSELAQ